MKINNEFNLSGSEGSSNKAQNYFVIIHETANASATGRNEATYMKRNWPEAYTTDIIGDKGIDYRIGEWGYESWGALNANGYAPVQIELQHSLDKATFQENYKAYIELIRKACDTYGIPKTLDTSGKYTKGVKSHDWISRNWGGDHTDPYSYLAKMGISKAQLAKDIANGISGGGTTVAKEVVYQTTPGLYEALGDDTFYLEAGLKTQSAWKIKKGQRFFLEDIVKTGSSGKYTRARVRLNNDIRYCTMRDDTWKLIYKTKAKPIK